MNILQFKNEIITCLILFGLSTFIFTRSLDVHGLEFRDDEIFYTKSTQEMVATGDYLSPKYFGEDRFQKPILFYWLILLSYKIFGVGWFGARFVAVVFSGLTVCVTWKLAKQLFDERIAFLSALMLMTMPMFFRHAKNAVPDMPLNFFIVLAIYFAVRLINSVSDNELLLRDGLPKKKHDSTILGSFFFLSCALGFMVKGLAAIVFPLSIFFVFLLMSRKLSYFKYIGLGRGLILMSVIIAPWFFYMSQLHGQEYVEYMVGNETKMRLLGYEFGSGIVKWLKMFVEHIGFYFRNIMSYFAPWSIFLVFSVPCLFFKKNISEKEKQSLLLINIWIVLVIVVFSSMYFVINHYMLILSTPLAILISWFLLADIKGRGFIGQWLDKLIVGIIFLVVVIGIMGLIFLLLLSQGASNVWILAILGFGVWGVFKIVKSGNCMVRAMVMAILLLVVYSQTALLGEAGITPHSKLQLFAKTIHNEQYPDSIISVGSHDLHEKEFQVYFDKKLEKSGASFEQGRIDRMKKLFASKEDFFLLILEKDYDSYVRDVYPGKFILVQEDFIIRKRMDLDGLFLKAIIMLDKKEIKKYMMERVLLLRKA